MSSLSEFHQLILELNSKGFSLRGLSQNSYMDMQAPKSPDQSNFEFHASISASRDAKLFKYFWGDGDTPEDALRAAMKWMDSGYTSNPMLGVSMAGPARRSTASTPVRTGLTLADLGLAPKKD